MEDRNSDTAELADQKPVSRVFRQPKSYRDAAIFLLIFLPIFFLGLGYLIGREAPPDRQLEGFLLPGVLWFCSSSYCLWGILAYRSVSLTIQNDNVILQGVFTRKVFTLSEVKESKWDLDQLILDPKTKAVYISLNIFGWEDQLWLIRYFRRELPQSSQTNWDRFCLRIAIPLQDRLQAELRSLEPDEILVTRQRYDRIGIPSNIILSLIGIYLSLKLDHFAFLILPIFSIGFWLFLRYVTPKKGMSQKRLESDILFRVFLWYSFLGGSSGLAIILILKNSILPEFIKFIIGVSLFSVWFFLLFRKLDHLDKENQEVRKEKEKAALQQWDVDSA